MNLIKKILSFFKKENPLKPKLSAVLQPRDIRDYDLSKVESSAPAIGVDYSQVPGTFQGKQPACGAHSGSTLEAYLSMLSGETSTLSNSPRFLWKSIKDIDGYPVETGTDMYSIFRALKSVGVCDLSLAPNLVDLPFQDYRNLPVTDGMTQSASGRRIEAFATTYSPTFDQIRKAVIDHGAILIQMRVGANMYTARDGTITWEEGKIMPLSATRFSMDSGHFVVGIPPQEGWDDQYVYWANSFGPTWGKQWKGVGVGYFGPEYAQFVYAIGTAIDQSQVTPQVLPKHSYLKDLGLGSTGDDVTALQKFLVASNLMAMPAGVAYGFFGTVTQQAVKSFQTSHGITPVSGYVGPLTRAALNK